jgi:hypothetical protein
MNLGDRGYLAPTLVAQTARPTATATPSSTKPNSILDAACSSSTTGRRQEATGTALQRLQTLHTAHCPGSSLSKPSTTAKANSAPSAPRPLRQPRRRPRTRKLLHLGPRRPSSKPTIITGAPRRLANPNRIPLFDDAKVSYAVGRIACAGAEPNPTSHLLYANKDNTAPWPYPTPQSKRFEIYYTLAGGSKSIGYWWLNPPEGLNNTDSACLALWKEMGLCGNEIKTARPLIVKSTPIDLMLTQPKSGHTPSPQAPTLHPPHRKRQLPERRQRLPLHQRPQCNRNRHTPLLDAILAIGI